MQIGVCLPYSEAGITRKTVEDWCRAIDEGQLGDRFGMVKAHRASR